jgi:hypothetical protein
MNTVELDSKRIKSIVIDDIEYFNVNFDPSSVSLPQLKYPVSRQP